MDVAVGLVVRGTELQEVHDGLLPEEVVLELGELCPLEEEPAAHRAARRDALHLDEPTAVHEQVAGQVQVGDVDLRELVIVSGHAFLRVDRVVTRRCFVGGCFVVE